MLTTYKTTLTEKNKLTTDVYLFKFILNEPKEISFIAGQYLILKIGDKSRLYSIASSDFQKDSFELLVQIIPGGLASTYLLNLNLGDEATFQGPAGVFRLKESPRDKIFMATGTGIAPIKSMLLSNSKFKIQNSKFLLFWGLPYYKDIYLFEELKNYGLRITNFHFKICLSREQNLNMVPEEDRKYFTLGHIDYCVETEIRNSQFVMENCEFYLCGSRHVTESLKEYLLTQKHVLAEQIVFEKF